MICYFFFQIIFEKIPTFSDVIDLPPRIEYNLTKPNAIWLGVTFMFSQIDLILFDVVKSSFF